jgi:alpha-L-fucosidase
MTVLKFVSLAVLLAAARVLAPAAAPYTADWPSLTRHPVPAWYEDAKFGVYFHWSAYSVPAYSNEWYSHDMYQAGSEVNRHHVATYGPLAKFGYKDFIPSFTAAKFNADEWADLIVRSGAQYAGPVAEHADGFALWDSQVNPWNAAKMGPKRDLVAELEQAIRRRHLKFIATFHHQWLWGWFSSDVPDADVKDPANFGFYGPALPTTAFNYAKPVPAPDAAFSATWAAKVAEVVDRYQPDLIYFDSRTMIIDEPTRQQMLAHFYNTAQAAGREVVMTYKNEDFAPGAGILDLEGGRMTKVTDFKWQTDDQMDWNSWAYLEHPNYKSADRLIHQLIDIVSKNGNLLLDVGPRPDGTIPQPVQERLLAIGDWLRTNGEAIYGTRPFTVFGEGPTKIKEGQFTEKDLAGFTAQDIRFTTKPRVLYATLLGWPVDGKAVITTLAEPGGQAIAPIRAVELLGHAGALKWQRTAAGLTVELPAQAPGAHAWVLKISLGG